MNFFDKIRPKNRFRIIYSDGEKNEPDKFITLKNTLNTLTF